MRSEGNDFFVAQGETFDAIFDIVDESDPPVPCDITGGAAAMTYWQGNGAVTRVPCTEPTTTAAISIPRETVKLMSGNYEYHFWARNAAGKIVRSVIGIIHVDTDRDPDAVAPVE